MIAMLSRLWAFVRGDMTAAEDIDGYPPRSTPPIIMRARSDEALARYLVEVAAKARDRTDTVLDGVHAKASLFLTLVVGLIPISLTGVALSVPPANADVLRWLSFGLMLVSSVLLLVAAVVAGLAAGFGMTASLNLERLEKPDSPKSMARLMADEADTWHYAAVLNMETSNRRIHDLYQSRRLTLGAMFSALLGIILLLGSVGGQPSRLLNGPSPSPGSPSVAPTIGASPSPSIAVTPMSAAPSTSGPTPTH